MMLEPAGEEDEADLLRQDDEANQSGIVVILWSTDVFYEE